MGQHASKAQDSTCIEGFKPEALCGNPTDQEDPDFRTLSCCDEHPNTYTAKLCKLVKCVCFQTNPRNDAPLIAFNAPRKLTSNMTVPPCHPWMPIYISYDHLACLQKNQLSKERSETDMNTYCLYDLWAVLERNRETEHIKINHLMGHELVNIGGIFYQLQDAKIKVTLQKSFLSLYHDKLQSCPHSSITLSHFELKEGQGIRGRIAVKPAPCTSHPMATWYGSQGFWARRRGCEICETEWMCKIEEIEGELHVFYSSIRKLGDGLDMSKDRAWLSLVSGQGIPGRDPYAANLLRLRYLHPETKDWIHIKGKSKTQRISGGVFKAKFPRYVKHSELPSYYEDSASRFFGGSRI